MSAAKIEALTRECEDLKRDIDVVLKREGAPATGPRLLRRQTSQTLGGLKMHPAMCVLSDLARDDGRAWRGRIHDWPVLHGHRVAPTACP